MSDVIHYTIQPVKICIQTEDSSQLDASMMANFLSNSRLQLLFHA